MLQTGTAPGGGDWHAQGVILQFTGNDAFRTATGHDRNDVSDVHVTAFPEGEGEFVSRLAICLLSERTTPQTISVVYEAEGTVVGHSPETVNIVRPGEHCAVHALHHDCVLRCIAIARCVLSEKREEQA